MNDLHQELKTFLIEAMNLEEISPEDIGDETPLFSTEGLGLDSIDALELVLGLKKRYGISIEANDESARQHLATISSLAAFVSAKRNPT